MTPLDHFAYRVPGVLDDAEDVLRPRQEDPVDGGQRHPLPARFQHNRVQQTDLTIRSRHFFKNGGPVAGSWYQATNTRASWPRWAAR